MKNKILLLCLAAVIGSIVAGCSKKDDVPAGTPPPDSQYKHDANSDKGIVGNKEDS